MPLCYSLHPYEVCVGVVGFFTSIEDAFLSSFGASVADVGVSVVVAMSLIRMLVCSSLLIGWQVSTSSVCAREISRLQ